MSGIPLTPPRLAAVYECLRAFPPFSRMCLPPPWEVTFKTVRGRKNDGEYWRWARTDDHTIAVSASRHSHFNSVAATVAHEMIHLSQARRRTETRGEHNAEFRRAARVVCRRFGWDEGQFI